MTRHMATMALAWLAALPASAGAAPASDTPAWDAAAARQQIDSALERSYPSIEALYRDIHAHPEVAFQEQRTAALLAARIRKLGFTVTEHVGGTGVVALYRNGPGPVVLVRTELDGLPMEEKTGLPFASRYKQLVDGKETPTAHSCGHDVHMAWWIATAQALVAMKSRWKGTLLFVAQPAEETVSGAKAMLADPAYAAFPKPDYAFAAHVGPLPNGVVVVKDGPITSASDAVAIIFHGRGAHGSMPEKSIDPILMGVHFASDVQTVISRQKNPGDFGVVTIGAFNAGTVDNIIPDEAELKLTLRSHDEATRKLLLAGVERTAKAAAAMADAPPPTITRVHGSQAVVNSGPLSAKTYKVMQTAFGSQAQFAPAYMPAGPASEDYSEFLGNGVQSVYFIIGGTDPKMIAQYQAEGKPLPVNHSPYFAPDADFAIRRGAEVLSLAVMMAAPAH
ncbi:MAG TPA: amidohydrolase [Sphingobium sp.]|nr:amidohydrolase [Sphingobium sp.]